MQKIYQRLNKRRLLDRQEMRYIFAAMISFCLITQSALSVGGSMPLQSTTVTGKVTDDTNSPLPGVSILEKGTNNGTVTDADGNYSITVASRESVLLFSFVGTKTEQVVVGGQSNISIKLVSDISTLDEVVVIGYGTQEKKDISGAVASVKSEDFNRGIINSPEQLIQGKVAGVNVISASGEPGAPLTISIRGIGGVRTGSSPLFVVDGLPLDNSSTGGSTNPLTFLNPDDIASIDVLKDASATAVYGSRGANGVVLITTKKGKAGKSAVTYSLGYGTSHLARPIDVFTADEYRARVVEVGGVLEDSLANTDWQKQITRSALTKNHNLTLSGGADKLSYYASLGMQDQEGIIKNSNMKRYSGRINVSQKLINDKLTIDVNLNAGQTINRRPPTEGNNGASVSIIGSALTANPTYPATDAEGKPYRYPSGTNPLRTLELSSDRTTINRLIGNISPSFEIIKGLTYKLNFGIDNSNGTRDIESMPSALPQQDGRLETIIGTNNNSLIENYLTYQFDKDDHSFSALAGHSYQKFSIQSRWFSINKFPISEIDPRNNPGLGQDLTLANNKPGGYATRNELQSFFGRVTYQFKDRYDITATVRADGSSKFGANNKYGTFPSFSAGWTISEESFMSTLPVQNLKLRLGWGKTGNQEIPSKITQPLFTSQIAAGTTYPLDGTNTYPAGTTYARLANPDIQWEVSTQTNIGLDFGFLSGALTGSVDYFTKVSNNILLEVIPADPVQPAGTYWTNVDDMTITNQGTEIAMNYEHKASSGFRWNVGGNITFINNKVEDSPYTVIPSGAASGSGLTSATINGYINGEAIGTFYLKEFIGFDENGLSVYNDTDGDGLVTDKDRIAAGSALPTKMYNFNASAGFKGFDLTVNFNGVSGNKVYDNTANANFYKLRISKGLNTTEEALQFPEESVNNAAPVSTRFLKDGSFLRMNNLTLGYTVSPKSIGLDRWFTNIRLSVTGQNLLLMTNYDGYDPEVNTDRTINGISSYGIDYLSYPKAKTYLFGINVSF
jgi:TonB-dependent starch-binding outer membrane protein SusC